MGMKRVKQPNTYLHDSTLMSKSNLRQSKRKTTFNNALCNRVLTTPWRRQPSVLFTVPVAARATGLMQFNCDLARFATFCVFHIPHSTICHDSTVTCLGLLLHPIPQLSPVPYASSNTGYSSSSNPAYLVIFSTAV